MREPVRHHAGLIVFIVFLVIEVFLLGLTIWDLARFNALSSTLTTVASTDASQLETARVTGWMLLAAVGQLVVATAGFLIVSRTLRANEASVTVATRALDLQQKTSADQYRAYVHAAAADIEWDSPARTCRVQFTFANTGQTPATFFEFGASFVEVPHGVRAKEQPIRTPDKFTRWSPIGSGDRVTAAWYENNLAERLGAYPFSTVGSGGVILISGIVRYGTIFGETYETDFAFFLRAAPSPDGSPMKLSRSTNAFRAYQRMATSVYTQA